MKKLVVNHLEKLFVTSDAATIVAELEVAHPAARMLVQAAKMQEQEVRRRPAPRAPAAAAAAALALALAPATPPPPMRLPPLAINPTHVSSCRSATAPTLS